MDDRNKILDVTYGSFSCRLEGFEDSVETMKTVVSFFHDLAGHDRFMDVAPQAPDMETLARLTAQSAGVSVEVEGEGQHVSLRVKPHDMADDRPSLRVQRPDTAHDDADTGFDADEDEQDVAEFTDDADDEDFDDLDAFEEDADDDDSAQSVPEPAFDPVDLDASVAEKLNRIRAVVGRGHMPAKDDTYAEDLTAREEKSGAVNPLAQRLAELAKRNSELRDLKEAEEAAAPDVMQDDLDDLDDDLSDLDEAEGDALEDVAKDDLDFDETYDDDALIASDDVDDVDDDRAAVPQDDQAVADNDEAAKPADLGPLVLTARDAAPNPHDDADDDDDFDLHEEVAKIEAEIASRRGNEVARHGLPRSVDDAMSRILSQTNQHLDQPESRRHRDAFAQLKAAVAATEAARQLGDAGGKARDIEEDFKDDLGAHDAEEKAEAPSLPPLKLVKNDPVIAAPAPQQSVSRPLDAAAARLRSIAAMKETDSPEPQGGFAEFAAEQGATDLVDLLEAAAAYISFVEGDADFSRPQVMRKVQSATGEEISREDGLRSFGRLLRQSRIIKLSNGRFQVAETSRFRPDGGKAARG